MAAGKQNLHLEHLEDDIINLGYVGAQRSIKFIEGLLDMLKGNSSGKVSLTTKWDGAPAIVAGPDPNTGVFFVSTKHGAFAKDMKLGYSKEFIDLYFGDKPELAQTLKIAYDELKDLGMTEVMQGDIMFTSKIKKTQDVGGDRCVTFKPNTIMYAVPLDDPGAQPILDANIGVVFHTRLTGANIVNALHPVFGANVENLKKSPTAWVKSATFDDASGHITLTAAETRNIRTKLREIKVYTQTAHRFLDTLAEQDSDLSVAYLFKIFVNSLVRSTTPITVRSLAGLEKFVIERIQKKEQGVKTANAKQKYLGLIKETQDFMRTNATALNAMFKIYVNMVYIKDLLVNKLNNAQNMKTFIETDKGFKKTDPEGYVAIDHQGNAVKLVNRLEFSAANFNAVKDWKPANAPAEPTQTLRTLVFAYGRMNPPTIGHKKLVDKVLELARNEKADNLIVLSHTAGDAKNPLDPDTKLYFAKKMFPNANLTTSNKQKPSMFQFLEEFNDKYDKVLVVAGSDRIEGFKKAFASATQRGTLKFKIIDVISAGQRDPDEAGAAGISASKMREYASKDDFKSFKKGLPAAFTDKDARALLEAVQEGMK